MGTFSDKPNSAQVAELQTPVRDQAPELVAPMARKKEVMIQFGEETCANLDAALHREFLETMAWGASRPRPSSASYSRYHGLLVAATNRPSDEGPPLQNSKKRC